MLCSLEMAEFALLGDYPTHVGIGGAAVTLVALLGVTLTFADRVTDKGQRFISVTLSGCASSVSWMCPSSPSSA